MKITINQADLRRAERRERLKILAFGIFLAVIGTAFIYTILTSI